MNPKNNSDLAESISNFIEEPVISALKNSDKALDTLLEKINAYSGKFENVLNEEFTIHEEKWEFNGDSFQRLTLVRTIKETNN